MILPLCAVALAIVLANAAGLATRPAAEAAYRARVREYEETAFPAVVILGPGQRAHGFVYFWLNSDGSSRWTGSPPRFAEETWYVPPTPTAVVTNMAGTATLRPLTLDIAIEDEEGTPAKHGHAGGVHYRLPLAGGEVRR